MTETEFAEFLTDAIGEQAIETETGTWVQTFADAGVMTMNTGLVVRLDNGSEFQLTIVQSA